MMMTTEQSLLLLLLALASVPALAQAPCSSIADDAERLACYDALDDESAQSTSGSSVFSERLMGERALWDNRFGILPHRRSYLLPLTYSEQVGVPLRDENGEPTGESLKNLEVKFQYSFKVPVGGDGVLFEDDQIYLAFTQRSLWQAYNRDLSSPFRESVYEPEIFWNIPLQESIFGGILPGINVGINHQSNGRGGELSRSWNRITAEAVWGEQNWALGLRVWQRIEEDADDDDNPDITDYLGYGELRLGYKWEQYRFNSLWRNGDGRTSVDLSFSWPLNEKLNGYVQFYNGYGETLIDYDRRIRRIGFGILLADWF